MKGSPGPSSRHSDSRTAPSPPPREASLLLSTVTPKLGAMHPGAQLGNLGIVSSNLPPQVQLRVIDPYDEPATNAAGAKAGATAGLHANTSVIQKSPAKPSTETSLRIIDPYEDEEPYVKNVGIA